MTQISISPYEYLIERLLTAHNIQEVLFILLNESRQIFKHEFAVFLPARENSELKLSFANLAISDKNAPCVQFLRRMEEKWQLKNRVELLEARDMTSSLRKEWTQWLPAHLMVGQVFFKEDKLAGYLLMGRSSPWNTEDALLLSRLIKTAGYILNLMHRPGLWTSLRSFLNLGKTQIILLTLLILSFIPVSSAILGLGEIVPLKPAIVRSPIDGIVKRMLVEPFQSVSQGQPLLLFEELRIDNQIQISIENLASAEEALRQAQQGALFMSDSILRLPELELKREEARMELSYLKELKKRMNLTAEDAGIVLIDNYPSWAGRAVSMGERLLTIADPQRMEVKIWVPAGDAALLRIGDKARLYLNLTPNKPIEATVYSIAYQPKESPKGILAYEVLAGIDKGTAEMRIGYFGTGRIYGDKMPLGFYLLRRPLAIMRMWLGI